MKTISLQWSGEFDPPEFGTRVMIRLNGWNCDGAAMEQGNIEGTVVGYSCNGLEFLMCWVVPDIHPPWWDDGGRNRALFAGRELELL